MQVRPYVAADAAALAQIFYDAVQTGAADHYNQAQRDAWCPVVPAADKWAARLRSLVTFVADDLVPIGFISMTPDGYIDLLFVTPTRVGGGVAHALYQAIEAEAQRRRLCKLTVQASHLAKPFFLRQDWRVDAPNTVFKDTVSLGNWMMSKTLIALPNG